MTPFTRNISVIALVLCIALPVWGEQYLLYAPQPAASGQITPSQDGVLVQEIEIRKGDTLYGLSRKFSGHGKYYPQILLFNTIKNPNLIYAGKKLKVPLSHNEPHDAKSPEASYKPESSGDNKTSLRTETEPVFPQAAAEPSLRESKKADTGKKGVSRHKKKSAAPAKKVQPPEYPVATDSSTPLPAAQISAPATATTPSVGSTTNGQKLFEAAISSYRRDDCRTALEQFDRFLAVSPDSPLAADANLYKAECYMKLSAQ